MKKLFTLFTLVALFASVNMAQIKLYVHQNDGSYTEFIAATVDSITFSEQKPEKDVANGYNYVDLGLTSGALWATCNLGADKPEEYGDYFAWGELKHKYRYEMNNYVGNASGKYDVYNILELEDDVVYKKMGGAWHIPSPAEINELKDECEWTWTSINNVNGYEVKGPNGNTIFLPAAGVFYETLDNVGKGGIYRANAKIGKTTFNLHIDEKYGVRAYYENEAQPGHSIRPVCHKINEKYTLKFSANGGEGEMESMSLQYGEHRILPEVSFIRENHAYTTWNTKADGTGTSYNNKSQISITEDIVLYAQWREIKLIDGYEYIDLGLPSGLLWANQNIGAEKPEEYGDYFAWGMTEPVKLGNYKWRVDNKYGDECAEVGFELVDDAARQIWGGGWRVPLPEEIEELIAECEWTWTSINNVNGYKVKGPNGNSIFLPAAGSFGIWGPNEELYLSVGEIGFYRGNFKQCQAYATELTRNQISASVNSASDFGNKTEGYSIRPVRNKTIETYTLTFDANGGEGEMDGLILENSEYKILPGSTFTKEGYVFASWNTKADGSGVSYTEKRQITLTENTTLYAQWSRYYFISFDANGGEGDMDRIEVISDNLVELTRNKYTRKDYLFLGWNTKADGSGDFYENEAQASFIGNTILYAQWKKVETNDYEYVDLGLSVKWATCNVGAEKPEGNGDYFAWGEVETKSFFTTSNYSFTNNPTVLALYDDAANSNMGGDWRMPTKAEFKELIDNCTMTTLSYGIKFTAPNGNYIILPFGGFKEGLSDLKSPQYGYYWTSDLSTSDNSKAYDIIIGTSQLYYEGNRHCGLSVRPVLPK